MSSRTTPKTVLLKGDPMAYEAEAGGAITPGMLLALAAGNVVNAHGATSAARFPILVAREEEYAGGGLDTAYVQGDRVPYWHMKSGDMFYALLENGANVAVGGYLASNAAGALEAAGANYAAVQAMEAVNNTSGGLVRIKVRVP